MTVYYLAGPMAGIAEHNHPAFHDAAAQLRARGLHIICPAEYGNLVTGWQECMKRDIHALLWCDAVIVLPGWEHSKGATLEANIADSLCMAVFDLHVMLGDGIPLSLSSKVIRDAYNTMHPIRLGFGHKTRVVRPGAPHTTEVPA